MPPRKRKATKVGTAGLQIEEKSEMPPGNPTGKMKRDMPDEIEETVLKKVKTDSKQMMNKTDTDLSEIRFSCEKLNVDGEKFNVKICSWNVSGIRAVIKKNGFEYIKQEDADIIALQEVKCDNAKLPNEVKLSGYERFFVDSKKQGYCGVALYSKIKPIKITSGLQNTKFDNEGRMITAEYQNFFLINVYVPNAGSKLVTLPKRLAWNAAFKEYVRKLEKQKPVIICGDMNVAHKEIDLTNPKTNTKNAGFTQEERDGMTEFLKEGFVDSFRYLYPEKTGVYSFWSYFRNSRSKNIGWRLDYFIVSERIKNKICDVVMRDMVYGSDHCPVVLYAHL